ncbi:uncharacterized protein LOC117806530 [Notolabrus celidotus]|uniref:uncharacterized protein LOC117806530 n=1 Tax=Notolabrus celidotus TaxID=1203425 RepID=UPI00148F750C|nr:uncharacterized protein LOC117806530 [Notolabrus celidotus]
MIILFLIIHFNIFLVSGSSPGKKVTQTPAHVYIKPGEKTATLNCRHEISGYYVILWYKQSDGQMQLLGYVSFTEPTLEKDLKMKVKIEGDANENKTCTLTIEEADLNSSAVYFCAASLHSAACHHSSVQKPALHILSSLSAHSRPHTCNKPLHLRASVGKEVNQDPSDVIKRPGEPAVFNCQHKISGYNRILWYKQLEDGQMQFLGYMVGDQASPEDKDKVVMETSEVQISCKHNDNNLELMLWMKSCHRNSSSELVVLEPSCTAALSGSQRWRLRYGGAGKQTGKKKPEHHEAHPARLNLLHPLDYHSVSTHTFCRVWGLFGEGGFQCDTGTEAYFGKGTKLTVLEKEHVVTPPNVTVFPPSKKECEDKTDQKKKTIKKTIVCVASGFYPDHVTFSWFLNSEGVSSGVATDSSAVIEPQGNKTYSISSRLSVSADKWYKMENEFICTVSFFDGTEWINETASVFGEEGKVRGHYLKVTQSAKLCYTVLIVKSCLYGGFVALLLLKLKSAAGKRKS